MANDVESLILILEAITKTEEEEENGEEGKDGEKRVCVCVCVREREREREGERGIREFVGRSCGKMESLPLTGFSGRDERE